ncbi:MAG: 30S ribosomal protein S4e [archaeon]|jgi:small subunit ribosomal protein S4e
MSKKGQNKKAKAISMPKTINVSKKNNFWTVQTKAGPYSKMTSVPLGIVVRNYIGIASTLKEAKKMLNESEVKVNGVVRLDHQFPVGLFDVIAIEKQKLFFRVMLDEKGRLIIKPIEKESKEKVSKITNKTMTSKGIQLTTNDGRTYIGTKANVGDSVKLLLPEGKIESVIELKTGATVYVTNGAHCSQIATITEIVLGTQRRDELVKLSKGKENFETILANVIAIGKSKPEMQDIQ